MFYLSYKRLNAQFEKAQTSAEKNALRKQRDALHIATGGGNKRGVYEKQYKKALNAYRLFKRLNRLNDRLLILDNDERRYNSAYTQYLHNEADALELKIKKALKGFKLKIVYYSWLARICDNSGREIGLNYII